MQQRPQCPKGHGSMTRGFELDYKDGMPDTAKWVPGEPEKGWFGIKLKGRKRLQIVTWRCNQCGLLESYAVE